MSSRTIVFIHGNFVSYHCWDAWIARYTARGYKCIAIPYPGRDLPVPVLRSRHPDPQLGRLGLAEVIDHHVRIIQSLHEKPIIIGHSFGGLLTQLMLDRGLGVAGITIDSVPPMGVISLQWSFYRSTWPLINPFTSRPYLMPFRHWQYTFVHTLPLAEQQRSYDREVVPESRKLGRGALTSLARVDFRHKRTPLLMIGGELDHIMPAALNRANARRYRKSPSVTEYKEFPGRTHYILSQPGWEEVADYAIDWAEKQVETQPRRSTSISSNEIAGTVRT